MKKFKFGPKGEEVELGVLFGVGSFRIYFNIMNCDFEGLDWAFNPGKKQLEALPALIYSGVKNFAKYYEDKVDVSTEEKADIDVLAQQIGEMSQDEYSALINYFFETKYFDKKMSDYLGVEEQEDTGSAKKKPSR